MVTRSIVVCIDPNSISIVPIRYACILAKKFNTSVKILSIIEEPSYQGLLFVSKAIEQDKKIKVEEEIKKIINKLSEEYTIEIHFLLKDGLDITTEIIRDIKHDKDNIMLVIGKSSGKKGDNDVLSKFSKQIASKITIPIVIVPDALEKICIENLV